MNSKFYKWCAVPQCTNTTIVTPNKVFIYVPNKKIIRCKWFKLARRNPKDVVTNSSIYFCEDHFDLPNDMENYMEYHVMGSVSQIRMKPGCMPKKFICQPDRTTQTSDTTERPYIAKKRRMKTQKCENHFEEKSIVTEQSSSEEIASGSSEKQRLTRLPKKEKTLVNYQQLLTSSQKVFNGTTVEQRNVKKKVKEISGMSLKTTILTRRKTQNMKGQKFNPQKHNNSNNVQDSLFKKETLKAKKILKQREVTGINIKQDMSSRPITQQKLLVNAETNTEASCVCHEDRSHSAGNKLCRDTECVMYGMNKNCGVLIHLYDFTTNAFVGRSFATLEKGFLRLMVGANLDSSNNPKKNKPQKNSKMSDDSAMQMRKSFPRPPSPQLLKSFPLKPQKTSISQIMSKQPRNGTNNNNKYKQNKLKAVEEKLRKTNYIRRKHTNSIQNNSITSKDIVEDIYCKKYPVKRKRRMSKSAAELLEEHAYANSIASKHHVDLNMAHEIADVSYSDGSYCPINEFVETVEFSDDMKDHVLNKVFDFGSDDLNMERVNIKQEVDWGENVTENVFDDLNLPQDSFLDSCGVQIKREPMDECMDESVLEDFSISIIPKQEQFDEIFGK